MTINCSRKLIEVALPLDAINAASVREKSIRHGHPSTLHLWWARRPLAAARAVIFAQMVDDPSAHPDRFSTEKAQAQERERLFGIIEKLVKWENTNDEEVLEQAREEIRESWLRTCIENADHPRAVELFDPGRLPAFHDPFAGGGALPLEAQRLGLEAHASDLNPVAVLINKAMIEIPPRFAGRAPVNPDAQAELARGGRWNGKGAQGLAEDVRYYGQWMRGEAEKRIGHLYPKIEVTAAMAAERPDLERYVGRKLTVIAWLWARTVKSPNPAFAADKCADYWSTMCTWHNSRELVRNTFGRQAIPMMWDYTEVNVFSTSSGNWTAMFDWVWKSLQLTPACTLGKAVQADASIQTASFDKLVSTDPPYYDNVGYADLSDFFYVWLRRALRPAFPDLFTTLAVPKAEELVATPYRHGGKEKAERFFLDGMKETISCLAEQVHPIFPITIYYAFKQSEIKGDGSTISTGWETFLDAVIRSGFAITGTWPMRTENASRLRGISSNALASSIVLVCRRRSPDTPPTSRRDFLATLRSELPPALADLQKSNIAPVDFAQAAIGPGMAIYTRYARVLEADGSPMPVRSALVEINRMLDETLARQEGDLDPDTRFCVAWYEQYGMGERAYGEAEVLFSAKNTSFEGLQRAGVVVGGKGQVRLRRRDELDPDWNPKTDRRITDWEGAQHLTRSLTAERGGGVAEAARLVLGMGAERAEKARTLAYRLYSLAERKRWAEEAHAYNILVTSWPQIQAEAARFAAGVPEQAGFGFSGGDAP